MCQSLFQGVDQGVTFVDDLVFHLENVLALPPFLFFQFLYVFLNAMLIGHCGRLPRLTLEHFDLLFGVAQGFFGGQYQVVRPLLQPLAGLPEMAAIGLQRLADGRLGMTFDLALKTAGYGIRNAYIVFDRGGALEQLFQRFLIKGVPFVIEAGKQQIVLRFVGVNHLTAQRQIAPFAAQGFDDMQPSGMVGYVECHMSRRRW